MWTGLGWEKFGPTVKPYTCRRGYASSGRFSGSDFPSKTSLFATRINSTNLWARIRASLVFTPTSPLGITFATDVYADFYGADVEPINAEESGG
jgi:hypothetical protein